MKKSAFVLLVLFTAFSFGQQSKELKTFTQKDLNAYKINENTFDVWDINYFKMPGDTITYFINPEEYKGNINYGIRFSARDNKVQTHDEDYRIFFLDIDIDKCTFNPKDSIAEITGSVSGGWTIYEIKQNDELKIFVGEKKDTLYKVRFHPEKYHSETLIVEYNQQVRDTYFTVDTLPAFHFKKLTYKRNIGDKRTFSIRCKVNEESVLAFAKVNCYTEIYDLGKLFFSKRKKPGRTIAKRAKDDPRFVWIIENNIQAKYRKPPKPAPKYYQLTEKAESFILSRQYAKAKEMYMQLLGDYPNVYARDLHNAVRCAILSRDSKNAFLFGEKLAAKGIGIKYFNAKIFDGLRQSAAWKNFDRRYDSISTASQSKFDNNLKRQLELLADEDQADYGLETRKGPQILFETTNRVTDKLVDFLEKNGFPSEEKIGVFMSNDTVISLSPRFNVMIRHAVQQRPKALDKLNELLDKSFENFEYDKSRSTNHQGFPNACVHIYKGDLYNSKSCGNNDQMVKKMIFKFNNPNNFIMDYGDYIVTEYDAHNPEGYDNYYKNEFNFVVKLTDDWKFYEK